MVVHKYIMTQDQVFSIYGIVVNKPCTVIIELPKEETLDDYIQYIGVKCYPKNESASITKIYLKKHEVYADIIYRDYKASLPFKDLIIEK